MIKSQRSLIALETSALSYQKSNDWQNAADMFQLLVKERPDWEQGYGYMNLAICLEELGKLEEARHAFGQALKYSFRDVIVLGNFASFLYAHGNTQEAYDMFVDYISEEGRSKNKGVSKSMVVLLQLGTMLGKTESLVMKELARQADAKDVRT